jgi:hypothetical protein
MTLSALTTKLVFKTNVLILVWMTAHVERVLNVSQRVIVLFVDAQLDGVVILQLNAINVGFGYVISTYQVICILIQMSRIKSEFFDI